MPRSGRGKQAKESWKLSKAARLAAVGHHLSFVFPDERIFTFEEAHNRQDDEVLAPCFSSASRSSGRLPQAKILLCDFITSNGKARLIFMDSGVKVSTQVYRGRRLATNPPDLNRLDYFIWSFGGKSVVYRTEQFGFFQSSPHQSLG